MGRMDSASEKTTHRPKRGRLRKADGILLLVILLFALAWAGYREYNYEMLQRPLVEAVGNGRVAEVEALLRRGADPNLRVNLPGPFAFWGGGPSKASSDDRTILMLTAGNPKTDILRLLLEHGADVNRKQNGSFASTALDLAALSGSVEGLKLLIAKGAEMNPRNEFGATPLFTAISHDSSLWRTASPSVAAAGSGVRKPSSLTSSKTGGAVRPTMLASTADRDMFPSNSRESSVRILLEHGADVNAHDSHGITPLLFATQGHYFQFVPLLLDHGADPNAGDDGGRTALMYAALASDVAAARKLLESGAKVDLQAANGDTALHKAIVTAASPSSPVKPQTALEAQKTLKDRADRLSLIGLLLDKGADIRLKNAAGKTALQIAEDLDDAEVLTLLRKAASGAPRGGKAAGR